MTEVGDKETALTVIGKRPEAFRWTINGIILTKADLLQQVESGSEIGAMIISLAKDLGDPENNNDTNRLGKRYQCLICGTELLATKPGSGRVFCCEQVMDIVEPKKIPSSD